MLIVLEQLLHKIKANRRREMGPPAAHEHQLEMLFGTEFVSPAQHVVYIIHKRVCFYSCGKESANKRLSKINTMHSNV